MAFVTVVRIGVTSCEVWGGRISHSTKMSFCQEVAVVGAKIVQNFFALEVFKKKCYTRTMNPFEFMKNASEIKEKAKEFKSNLEKLIVTGSSGGNMVQIKINGRFEVLSIKLDPICVDNRDIPMLEDLIVAAHHDALAKMQEQIKEKAAPIFGGFEF